MDGVARDGVKAKRSGARLDPYFDPREITLTTKARIEAAWVCCHVEELDATSLRITSDIQPNWDVQVGFSRGGATIVTPRTEAPKMKKYREQRLLIALQKALFAKAA